TGTFPLHNITLQTLSQQTFNIKNFCWDGACALEWLWNSYEDNDIRRASWLEGPQYAKDGTPLMLDPNRQLTYTPYVGPIYNQTDPALLDAGVRMCKWEYEDGLAYQAMSNDFPIYRLSDIYLLKSECLIRQESGTATAEAVKYANYVRERAGATLYTTETLTLDELLRERARELCWEGHRRQDQVRFGTYSKPWDNKTNTDSYRDIYPIPYRVMNTNPNLIQNPGY
ncbi:MAG: RagB/SusD family nutrient uptake outer membrane protein, partial [Bacteroidales bacterium]|nr:RagB/SusD family nutrient uptake outer membrane protein [Bacteroidales bacterium]